MRKTLFLLCASMLLVCCQPNPYDLVAVGEPIMPVRM